MGEKIELEKFDEDGINVPDGQCWIDGELCIHREHFKGCIYDYKDEFEESQIKVCIRRYTYRQRNPERAEDESQYIIKPKKKKVKK